MRVRAARMAKIALVALIAGGAAGLVATGENGYSQEMKVDTFRDRFEIIELLNRHQIYIDLKDAERYASVFSADGRYDSPFASARGTQELIAMSRGLETSGFTRNNRHFNGPVMVDIKGDRATALSYWWVANYADKTIVMSTGTYRDELRKIDGQWRIVHRVLTMDAPEPTKK